MRWLESRRGPLAAGLLGLAVTWWVWGRWAPLPVIHDEVAYVLQARIFASGHWSRPAPPMPEPFEEYHVLVQPVLAAKYHPGHSLALTPGAYLGAPQAGPLAVSALTGALVFALARNLAGGPVAALTTLFWLLAPMNLKFRSTYLSQVTTSLLWVLALFCLERWLRTWRRGWLAGLALAVAACALTRPLTGLVLAVVTGAVVLHRVWQTRRPLELVLPFLLLLSVPAVLRWWSWATTGNPRESPRDLYTRQYMPWDRIGFGLDSASPAIPVSPDFKRFAAQFDTMHAEYTPARVPAALAVRTWSLLYEALGAGVVLLLPCIVAGAWRRPAEAWVGLGAVGLLLLAHLIYAHPRWWTPYYLEGQAILAYFAAAGALAVARLPRRLPDRSGPGRGWRARSLAVAARILLLACLGIGVLALPSWRRWHRKFDAYARRFADRVSSLGSQRAVVFVRYAAKHYPDISLIDNPPDVASAPVWVVLDLGNQADRTLMTRAGGRQPFLLDECTGRLSPWEPGASVPDSSAAAGDCPWAKLD